MGDRHGTSPNAGEVTIQLLDPTYDWPLKTWKFADKSIISIGRALECDVEILDSYVSRTHAVFERQGENWVLTSQGRNGVYVSDERVSNYHVDQDMTFRLGTSGPKLAFRLCGHVDQNRGTICMESTPAYRFDVDQSQLDEEVKAIAERDDFQRLQEQARVLRQNKQSM